MSILTSRCFGSQIKQTTHNQLSATMATTTSVPICLYNDILTSGTHIPQCKLLSFNYSSCDRVLHSYKKAKKNSEMKRDLGMACYTPPLKKEKAR